MADNKPNNPNQPPEENWLVSFGRGLGDVTGLNDLFAKDPTLDERTAHEQAHRDKFAYKEFKVDQSIKEAQDKNKEEIQRQTEASAKRAEQADISSGYDKLSGLNVQTPDKRTMANSELKDSMGSGVLSLVNPPSSPFADIPTPTETKVNDTESVLNNFNVNVNINGGNQNPRAVASAANTAMKNALPTLTGAPAEVKKNSSTPLQNNSRNTSIQNNITQNTTQVLPAMMPPQSEDNWLVSLGKSLAPSVEGILGSIGIDIGRDETLDAKVAQEQTTRDKIAQDTYTRLTTQMREKEVLHNIVENSIVEPTTNISPISQYNNSVYVENITNEENVRQIQNLNVQNTSTNHNIAQQIQSQNDTFRRNQDELINKIAQETETKEKTDSLGMTDTQEATGTTPKEGVGPTPPNPTSNNPGKVKLTDSLVSTPMFITKMNSPPSWRTVLG